MKRILPLLFTALLLSACNEGENVETGAEQSAVPEPLEVDLQVSETADANEIVRLLAIVKQGTEAVTDADEVEFEVWQEGQKEASNLLTASHTGKGEYVAETTFTEAGVYFIQSHVTARDLHTMPETSITISGPEPAAEKAHPHSHEQTGTVTIHLAEPGPIQVNHPEEFSVHVRSGGTPLTGADVTMELWQDGFDKHEWVNLTEAEGSYTGSTGFAAAGPYHVRVHVMKESGSIHEHFETDIDVLE